MNEQWAVVDNIRAKSDLTPQDVIDLEYAMTTILDHLGTEIHHKQEGYSVRFPRYRLVNNDVEDLPEIRKHFWARHRELNVLRNVVEKLEKDAQRMCTHEWERDLCDRGHRSTYYCRKCGKYR